MLSDIRSSFDLLVSNIQSFIDWATSIEQKEKLLNEQDLKLRERQTLMEKKIDELGVRENKLKSDGLIIDEKLLELEKGKAQIQTIQTKLEELNRKDKEIKEKQINLDERETKIKTREAELDLLKDTEKELDHRETLLKKEMLMDKIRQDKMDERDKEFDKEKARIQQIAQRIGTSLMI